MVIGVGLRAGRLKAVRYSDNQYYVKYGCVAVPVVLAAKIALNQRITTRSLHYGAFQQRPPFQNTLDRQIRKIEGLPAPVQHMFRDPAPHGR